MEFTFFEYLGIFLFIGFAGFVDAIAGGGGLISVPTYIAAGLPVEFILGTNKCVSASGTSLAVFRYIRSNTIIWRLMLFAIIAAFIGSMVGASFSEMLSQDYMVYLLLVIIPLIFGLNYLKLEKTTELSMLKASLRSFLIGLVIGGYDGFFGPGTGTFLLIAFVTFLNMDYVEASANARIVNYSSNLAAVFIFFSEGKILWEIALVALIASLLGNWLGSGMALTKADKVIKPVFHLVLGLLLIKCIHSLV